MTITDLESRSEHLTRAEERLLRSGELLSRENLISEEQVAQILFNNPRGLRLGELILDLGLLTEEQLLPHISTQLHVPGVRLRDGVIDTNAARLIPIEIAQRLRVLALFRVRDTLTVAMDEPHDLRTIDAIESLTGFRVRPVFAFRESILRMISRCYLDDFKVDVVTVNPDESRVELSNDISSIDLSSVEQMVDGSPIINLVNYVIVQAIRKGASDVHIEPSRNSSSIRFRVDGQLQEMLRPREDFHPAVVSRIKVMAKMDIAEHHIPQDGRLQVAVGQAPIDLRVSTLPTVHGEKVVIRILDRGRLTFDLEELGIFGEPLDELKRLLKRPHGLLLVTGPTVSGKTTTLYSALESIKSVHQNIVTVEDPVEYQIDSINQVQVDKARGLDFAVVLRSILRQDPDVIMVGEIRDPETANVAIQAALTGHLVISTLHTNDSCGAITRLVDMGIPTYKVAAALQGVVAQRLVRGVCPACAIDDQPAKELMHLLRYKDNPQNHFQRGAGCRGCYETGYLGRRGIFEVLVLDSSFRKLISRCADADQLRQHFKANGGEDLLQAGLELAERHLTSLDEVARVAFTE